MTTWTLQPDRHDVKALHLAFDSSASATLRHVLTADPSLFKETDPTSADLIVFGSDEIAYVDANPLYRAFPRKCICITESDIPTFRLPGLYAANSTSWITQSRTRTMNYWLSQIDRPNLDVRERIGKPVEKQYLYSFMGGSNSWTRKRLLLAVQSRADTIVQATDSYNHWNADQNPETKALQRERYADVMAASRYILCPRGCGNSSYRLFESMSLGIAPVILSDKWRPVEGVDWSFALFIPERDISQLDRILREHEQEWEQRGENALATYRQFFSPAAVPWTLYQQLAFFRDENAFRREGVMARVTQARASGRQMYWRGYGVAKHCVLKACHLANLRVPVPLNRPLEEQLKTAKRH